MEALAGLAASAGGGTAILTIIVRLFSQWRGMKQERYLMKKQVAEFNMKAISDARQYSPWHAVAARFLMLTTSLGMLVFITIYGAFHPEVIIHFPIENKGWSFQFLFLEFHASSSMTWKEITGLVILPTWFLIIGTSVGFFFGRAITAD